MQIRIWILMTVIATVMTAGSVGADPAAVPVPQAGPRVKVIAHRGASYELPEHTLAAYQLAMEQGAHYVEPDLLMTSDRHLIAFHDYTLNRSTDIADRPEFADRARTNDKGQLFWVPGDFTLEELKTLRVRVPGKRPAAEHDFKYQIATLREVVDLVRAYVRKSGRVVGLAPELRGATDEFVALVKELGLDEGPEALPLFIQSFGLGNLKAVRPHVKGEYAWLLGRWPERETWEELRQWIDGFAFNRNVVLAEDAKERIAEAHAFGFRINAWTFAEDYYNKGRFESLEDELALAIHNGIDTFFTDNPDVGVRVAANPPAPPREWTWEIADKTDTLTFDVGDAVTGPGTYRVRIAWVRGQSALKLHSVALYQDSRKVAETRQEGWTGTKNRDNVYLVEVPPASIPGRAYTLKVEVTAVSSVDSSGIMTLRKQE